VRVRKPSLRRFKDHAKAEPDDPLAEGEWHRAWRDLWKIADRPQAGDLMYVLGVLAAATAYVVAQEHHLHPLPTAGWIVGVGIGVLFVLRVAIFAGTKHWAPKLQRKEARDALDDARKDVKSVREELQAVRTMLDERTSERDTARAQAAAARQIKLEVHTPMGPGDVVAMARELDAGLTDEKTDEPGKP
jgi:hypothetical protein